MQDVEIRELVSLLLFDLYIDVLLNKEKIGGYDGAHY